MEKGLAMATGVQRFCVYAAARGLARFPRVVEMSESRRAVGEWPAHLECQRAGGEEAFWSRREMAAIPSAAGPRRVTQFVLSE